MMRVFLVEDEPPALRKLQRMVATQGDLAVCGTASTYHDAVAGILQAKPDLLILDIRLPDGTGFEILQTINDPGSFQVIFLTAYDEYALAAFDAAALDYLVKPVTQERFQQAIQRACDRFSVTATKQKPRYTKRFLVERLKTVCLLPVESVDWIAADRNYALIYSSMGEFALRATMDSLEQRLDPDEFVRVSRSVIVRMDAIREVRDLMLVLRSGAEVACSKRYWTAALTRLQ
ncbi:MAG TPA: LytTR family DNA-binding domain-containing protein [Pseudacidobacterium sp.]|jgi:two-component system LytT family response regulator|nr:LytTR family DNA-binding domain-containing protein [Pseudacidobacterium sp.]